MTQRAAVLLSMFGNEDLADIVRFVLANGAQSIDIVRDTSISEVRTRPALDFFPRNIPVRTVINLVRWLPCLLTDSMLGQWDSDKYVLALTRSAGISEGYARKLVPRILTEDTGTVLDFTFRMLSRFSTLAGPLTSGPASVLGSLLSAIDGILPTALTNKGEDVLFEWQNAGEIMGEMATRSALTIKEVEYERKKPEMGIDKLDTVQDFAAVALPYMTKALLGLLPYVTGTSGGSPALPGGPTPPLLEGGDIQELVGKGASLMSEVKNLRPTDVDNFSRRMKDFASKASVAVNTATRDISAPNTATAYPMSPPNDPLCRAVYDMFTRPSWVTAIQLADMIPRYKAPMKQLYESRNLEEAGDIIRSC